MERIPQEQQEQKKFTVDVGFDDLAAVIPEFKKMIGFDQKNDYHTLTLDVHTKEVDRQLLEDPFVLSLPPRMQKLIHLAALMHDLGKTDDIGLEGERGRQIHPTDPNKFRYVGHEKVSASLAEKILRNHFDLPLEELAFVVSLVALHDEIMKVINIFSGQQIPPKAKRQAMLEAPGRTFNLPSSSDLTPYGYLMDKVSELPIDISIKDKLNIVISFGLADKKANYTEESRTVLESSPRESDRQQIAFVLEKCRIQLAAMNEFRKAMPAIVDAVIGMRAGDNARPSVVQLPSGEYIYDKNIKVDLPVELDAVVGLSAEQKEKLIKPFTRLKLNLEHGDLSPSKDMARGLLRHKMRLTDEQLSEFLSAAGYNPDQIEVLLS
ncbi:TPA: hypothetical protein DF272_01855 [Candidatus Falkowbacteria bacterium]|nr:hypothetical protein [Candidatus Falkowbacteria bacterium]